MSASIFNTKESVNRTKPIQLDSEGQPIFKVVIQQTGGGDAYTNDHQADSLPFMGIVLQVSINTASRTTWTHTLGKAVFAYTFGTEVYDIIIGGVGFIKCNETQDGFSKAFDFYKDNNIAAEGKYCKIILGKKNFNGYLMSSSITTAPDPAEMCAFPFKFMFKAVDA